MISLPLLVACIDELAWVLRVFKLDRALSSRFITIDQLSRPVSKELVPCCKDFVSIFSKLLIQSRLLTVFEMLLEFDVFLVERFHVSFKDHILEALLLSDVIVVREVDTRWKSCTTPGNDVQA